MKKITLINRSIISAALLLVILVVPSTVRAQQSGVIEVGGGQSPAAPTTPLPSTGGSDAAAPAQAPAPATPNTGIAPSENKPMQNALVFIGGGALGAGIGFGIITVRKKNLL